MDAFQQHLQCVDGHPPNALADIQLRWDWSPWLQLLGRAAVESCDSALALADDLEGIRQDWAGRLAGLRADATAH